MADEPAPRNPATGRLRLHPVDVDTAERIRDRTPNGNDRWAADYPFDGDLAAIGGFLRASTAHGDQRPFGYYQIITKTDDTVVGGIGFIGPPDDGVVEIGYGLAASARGHGYATEAVRLLLEVAAAHGVRQVIANTTHDNLASQRTLLNSGLTQVDVDADLVHYSRTL
jgi:RimJ/RimL family protein N-acetyltransferase